MKIKYPNYKIISDIESKLNLNIKGLQNIIDSGIKGEIKIVIVAYKDRLSRFEYELIERIINKYSNEEIKIENNKEEKTQLDKIIKDIHST